MRLAFPTDEHHPYADERARSVALQIVEDFDPEVMVCGSDGMDWYSVSRFDKDPGRLKSGGLQEEIDAWQVSVGEWKSAAPNAEFYYIPGNHEDRWQRYIWKHAELYGLRALALPSLLELDRLGVIYASREVPGLKFRGSDAPDILNGELEIAGRLIVRHGHVVRQHSGYSAKAEMENELYSRHTLTGHTHRGGLIYATTRDGIVQSAEGFCLCSLEPSYVKGVPNWQHGIVLTTVAGGIVTFEPIPFHVVAGKKTAYWRDRIYTEE